MHQRVKLAAAGVLHSTRALVLSNLLPALILACCATAARSPASEFSWDSRVVATGGRIDAICRLDNEVLLAGSRDLVPGVIYRSTDKGDTWEIVAEIADEEPIGNNVTALAAAHQGEDAWALTGNGRIRRTQDGGLTWETVASIPEGDRFGPFQRTYGIVCLPSGTLLVSDTQPDGGHVYRSEDGGSSWHNAVRVSSSPLYRFQQVGDGVIVNGWSGRVYRSSDDGRTWTGMEQLTNSPLYATAYLGDGVVLQGSEAGEVFRSADNGRTWSSHRFTTDASDDFASLGDGIVLFTTYTGARAVYRSDDWGTTWCHIGAVPTGAEGDWLDHVIGLSDGKTSMAVGGTGKGHIVRYLRR